MDSRQTKSQNISDKNLGQDPQKYLANAIVSSDPAGFRLALYLGAKLDRRTLYKGEWFIPDEKLIIHGLESGEDRLIRHALSLGHSFTRELAEYSLLDLVSSVGQGATPHALATLLGIHHSDAKSWRDRNGNTLLHVICEKRAEQNFQSKISGMLMAGLDVNATNAKGQTPLHCVSNKHVALELMDGGADMLAKDAQGHTPMRSLSNRLFARKRGNSLDRSMLLDCLVAMSERHSLLDEPHSMVIAGRIVKMRHIYPSAFEGNAKWLALSNQCDSLMRRKQLENITKPEPRAMSQKIRAM